VSLNFLENKKRREFLFSPSGGLSLLLDAYEVIDQGVRISISKEERKGKKLACSKGCFHCCKTHRDIPLYPHEITGIYWYVLEKFPPSLKETLTLQLLAHKSSHNQFCPFLIDGLCSIHIIRPAACRLFNVFNRACSPEEDPFYTRKEDVLIPPRDILWKAFLLVLPFYNIQVSGKDTFRARVMIEEFIHTQAISLHKFDWGPLGRRLLSHHQKVAK